METSGKGVRGLDGRPKVETIFHESCVVPPMSDRRLIFDWLDPIETWIYSVMIGQDNYLCTNPTKNT